MCSMAGPRRRRTCVAAYGQVSGRITVPVPSAGGSLCDRQAMQTLQPYMKRSSSSPGRERLGDALVGHQHRAAPRDQRAHRPQSGDGVRHAWIVSKAVTSRRRRPDPGAGVRSSNVTWFSTPDFVAFFRAVAMSLRRYRNRRPEPSDRPDDRDAPTSRTAAAMPTGSPLYEPIHQPGRGVAAYGWSSIRIARAYPKFGSTFRYRRRLNRDRSKNATSQCREPVTSSCATRARVQAPPTTWSPPSRLSTNVGPRRRSEGDAHAGRAGGAVLVADERVARLSRPRG